MFSAKSWRSGAGTVLVTEGSSGLVAAAFLAHGCPDITQKYYHKGGDFERLQQGAILAASLRSDASCLVQVVSLDMKRRKGLKVRMAPLRNYCRGNQR